MYRILIVDDEKNEREGIALLIKRFGLELESVLAANGEEALDIITKKPVDILLTDIKMPYMDGIQLIKKVRELGLNPICIIYSAYGEFDYAQTAISLGVSEYLLKPIQLDTFKKMFEKIVRMCDEKKELCKKQDEFTHYQEEATIQKLSWKLLNYLEGEGQEESYFIIKKRIKENLKTIIDFETEICVPLLISSYSNLFARVWDEYRKEIEEYFGENTILINNTDNQVIALMIRRKCDYKSSKVKKLCEVLLDVTKQKYQADIFVVMGKYCDSLEGLKKEYCELKDQSDYQFFIKKSQLLIHDETYTMKKENNMLSLYFECIFNCAKMQDYKGMQKEFKKVFTYIADNNGFSSIYIKYTFTDAIKRINEYAAANIDQVPYIEQIYQAKNIENVSSIIENYLLEMEICRIKEQKENRLVRMAKEIVYEKYGENNLNVSFIADELRVSSAYLSNLYKVETGTNLVKFITQYRIERAKELLRQTNMRINDVAQKVGYINVSYFTSIFRNHEGCSPAVYREKEGS